MARFSTYFFTLELRAINHNVLYVSVRRYRVNKSRSVAPTTLFNNKFLFHTRHIISVCVRWVNPSMCADLTAPSRFHHGSITVPALFSRFLPLFSRFRHDSGLNKAPAILGWNTNPALVSRFLFLIVHKRIHSYYIFFWEHLRAWHDFFSWILSSSPAISYKLLLSDWHFSLLAGLHWCMPWTLSSTRKDATTTLVSGELKTPTGYGGLGIWLLEYSCEIAAPQTVCFLFCMGNDLRTIEIETFIYF